MLQMKTFAHHLLTDAQPVPKQLPRDNLLLTSLLSVTSYGMEYLFV